jgi:hypothetical protein
MNSGFPFEAISGLWMLPFIFGSPFGLAVGFLCGLVISLVVGVRKTLSFIPQVSLIVSLLFGFIYISWILSFSCLNRSGFDECIDNIYHSVYPLLMYLVLTVGAMITTVPFCLIGVALGILLRYIAGVIAGTYRTQDIKVNDILQEIKNFYQQERKTEQKDPLNH